MLTIKISHFQIAWFVQKMFNLQWCNTKKIAAYLNQTNIAVSVVQETFAPHLETAETAAKQ